MEKEKEAMRKIFWEQFPEGTEQFAYSIEEHLLQAMAETGEEEITLLKLHNAIGIAVGHLLQVTCQIHGYMCEKEINNLLYGALKKAYEHYKKYPSWPE